MPTDTLKEIITAPKVGVESIPSREPATPVAPQPMKKTKSGQNLRKVLGRDFTSREDLAAHMEEIKSM